MKTTARIIERNLAAKNKVLGGIDFPCINDAVIVRLSLEVSPKQVSDSMSLDPYWPKWDSPWWKMALLSEMGLAQAIPGDSIDAAAESVNSHYLHHFPVQESEMPGDKDPYRHVICHCALGTIYSIISKAGGSPGMAIPWARDWFVKYALPDGGYNCDDGAYRKENPKSSFVSTLPPLEALIFHTRFGHTVEESKVLAAGAQYLLSRKLCRSLSRKMAVADPLWLKPCFPRFYHYDILRGLDFVTAWADRTVSTIPVSGISEAIRELDAGLDPSGRMIPRPSPLPAEKTLAFRNGNWEWEESSMFPLLQEYSDHRKFSPWLTRQWYQVVERTASLLDQGLLCAE